MAAQCTIEGQTEHFGPNSTLIVPPDAVHQLVNTSGEPMHLIAALGMHYLLTWNCAHLANAERRDAIEAVCRDAGYEPPVICTPEELMGEQ